MTVLIIYIAVISTCAAIMTIYDKIAAKLLSKSRIPENVLLTTAAAGGAFAMYTTMLMIRHKTRHTKFMAGLPIIISIHLLIIIVLLKHNVIH